nr:MAG TPA: hypothetical protein [Caudoviricetes sp.]
MNINKQAISMCVNGKRKSAGGYHFIAISDSELSEKPPMEKINSNNEKLKNTIDFIATDFAKYHSLMSQLKEEYEVLKAEYEKLKESKTDNVYKNIVDMMLDDFANYRERVFQHFDKKDNRIKELELKNLALTECIQVIISAR